MKKKKNKNKTTQDPITEQWSQNLWSGALQPQHFLEILLAILMCKPLRATVLGKTILTVETTPEMKDDPSVTSFAHTTFLFQLVH